MSNDTGLRIDYGPHSATIEVSGALTDGPALQLDRMLTVLRDYYGYRQIQLRIHSPGGQLLALQHMLAALGRWRAAGGKVATHATMETGSAAALLLAMGELGARSAQPHTQLLFHHTRILTQGDSGLTAASAVATAQRLLGFDQALIDRVVGHLQAGRGGAQPLGQAGGARCAALRAQFNETADALGLRAERREPSWLKNAAAAYDRVTGNGKIEIYSRLLARRFERDERMDLREAWVLQLIDDVEGVPVLSPEPEPRRSDAQPRADADPSPDCATRPMRLAA